MDVKAIVIRKCGTQIPITMSCTAETLKMLRDKGEVLQQVPPELFRDCNKCSYNEGINSNICKVQYIIEKELQPTPINFMVTDFGVYAVGLCPECDNSLQVLVQDRRGIPTGKIVFCSCGAKFRNTFWKESNEPDE